MHPCCSLTIDLDGDAARLEVAEKPVARDQNDGLGVVVDAVETVDLLTPEYADTELDPESESGSDGGIDGEEVDMIDCEEALTQEASPGSVASMMVDRGPTLAHPFALAPSTAVNLHIRWLNPRYVAREARRFYWREQARRSCMK